MKKNYLTTLKWYEKKNCPSKANENSIDIYKKNISYI